MTSTDNITGLILAGGAGRRAGHRDKGLIGWQGRPLIAHVHDCLQPQVGTLLISCNRNFASYEAYAALTVADNRRDFQGPLAGIEAALPHIHTNFLVVVTCDMPKLPKDLAQRLVTPLQAISVGVTDISYAHDGIREQYLCAAMRRDCLSTLSGFLDAGHRAVKDWYRNQRTTVVDFSGDTTCFENYNELA
jgi:molybdenum cofactor guanylyltransferase